MSGRPWSHPAALDDDALLAQCRLGRSRGSGPGGQHRNKVQTLVTLTHEPTGTTAQAGERRSAADNKRVALRRLRLILATRVRTPVPPGDHRSDLWRARIRAGRIVCSPRHADYPALLAEAMDAIHACYGDHKAAALRLGCTPTQLVRFIAEHPPALEAINTERTRLGLHRLR